MSFKVPPKPSSEVNSAGAGVSTGPIVALHIEVQLPELKQENLKEVR